MSAIATDLGKIVLKKGATWGTAVSAASGGIYLWGRLTYSGGFDNIVSDDIGFAGKRTLQTAGKGQFNCTITCDTSYNGGFLALVAAFMGTEAAATETTGGQGDYNHTIDLANTSDGLFYSVGWLQESDRGVEIPSFKPTQITFSQSVNDKGTVTIAGIADQVVSPSTVNTAAVINAVSVPTNYQSAVLGGTNHYFRINSDSGAGLTNTDDKQILQYSFTIQRTLDPLWVLRAANTKYSLEPKALGDIIGTLNFQMGELDDANIDFLAMWTARTTWKAEIFEDGSQIGAGVNRSLKFQFPYLQTDGSLPPGHDLPAKNQRMQPSITMAMLKRSAAPTGMTGVTDYARFVAIDNRSTQWTA